MNRLCNIYKISHNLLLISVVTIMNGQYVLGLLKEI